MSINKIPVKAFTAGDLALDTFTATAGQTAFTLSVASTNNSVIVTVNDVLQVPPADYSVNGTTLTFTSGLELDDEVVVRIVSRPSTFGTVEDGAISSAKLATGAIEAKLGYTPVSPTQLNNLIDSAPTALDTLNELAAALNDDANFASTVTTALAGKQDSLGYTPVNAAGDTINDVVGIYHTHKVIEQFQFGGSSITDEYLLLVPNPDTTPANPYQIMGEIYSSRGSDSSGNSYAVDEINVGRAYTSRYGNIQTRPGSSTSSFVRLHYVTYNGVKWIAAKARKGGGPAHNGIFFRGWILNQQTDTFRRVREGELTNITSMYTVGGAAQAGSAGVYSTMASGFFNGINNSVSIPIDPSYMSATVYIRGRHDQQGANGYISMMGSNSSLYVTENNTFTIRRGSTEWAATGNTNYCKLNSGSYVIDAGLDWSGVFVVNQNIASRSSVMVDFHYTYNNVGTARTTGSMQYNAIAPCYGLNFDWDGSTVTPNLWLEYVVMYNRITENG